MKRIESVVPQEYNGVCIKTYLLNELKLTKNLIKKVKWGFVFVNDETVTMRYMLKAGQTVTVNLSDGNNQIKPIPFPLSIVYEDDNLLVVNKPTDMPTHPSKGNSLPTLAEGVIAYMGEDFVFRAVNRLDRDTSGIVIIAKDAFTASLLSKNMKNGDFKKKYLAILDGIPKEKKGIIDAPIERECEGSIKRTVTPSGKRAITEYEIIATKDERSLAAITLHTGRTHQIRVHMAYIGTPLYSDFLYGTQIDDQKYNLHARSISFTHPITKERMELTCEPDFTL